MAKPKQKGLGRGLETLLPQSEVHTDGGSSINEIPLNYIEPNPDQPRQDFDADALNELADSIRENGIISPITLRQLGACKYQIIAGERRWRAAEIAGLKHIPAYVRTVEDEQVMTMALIENIQREDLNAIEVALAYNKLMEISKLTQEQLAQKVGKKRATVTNYLRLLKLPAEVQIGIKDGKIEMGHARALAGLENPTDQLQVYEDILKKNYSVRQTETAVRKMTENKPLKAKKSELLPDEINALSTGLSKMLKAKVTLSYGDNGRGRIVIPFASDEELARLMELFDKLK